MNGGETPLTRVYLSLGTNLGDRMDNLGAAVRAIDAIPGVHVTAVSPVYETAPIGEAGAIDTSQPAYLNCALAADVSIDARALRARTGEIERQMGRGEHGRWESRVIDIDLVLYGAQQISEADLTVPHPRMFEREFVLRPLLDIDPRITAPRAGALAPLLAALAPQGVVRVADAP